MATVRDIFDFINTVAPSYMKESWDNVGLNCGRMDKEVKTILVALDPFETVCKEAADTGADLLDPSRPSLDSRFYHRRDPAGQKHPVFI